jgi:hypothetical protein
VFKNSDIEIIIPDIRTSNWAALYAVAFKKEGTYPMPFYIYGIKSHRTMRELLYVNTRTKVAVVVTNGLTPPDRYDLCKPDPSMPIDRITSIVEDVSNKFHGQTVDEAIVIQEYFLAQQADCVHNDPDCNLSGADYRIKHPRSPSPKTPTQVLLAQIAQFTARAPKDSCKAAPNTSARHNPVPPLAADITLTRVAMLPEHIVFHEDSIVVGHQDPFEDDLYVVANVRVINRLKVPLHLNDITVVLTAPDDTQTTASAANKEDLPCAQALRLRSDPARHRPSTRRRDLRDGPVHLPHHPGCVGPEQVRRHLLRLHQPDTSQRHHPQANSACTESA